MATMTESDFQRKLAGNFRISPADLARLSPEQQQLYQQKMLQAAAPASLQGAFGEPQAAAGGVPVDHAHGATLAQIAANQQAQLKALNQTGMLGGIRQSPKNTNYDHKTGLEYLRSADEVAARQDAWQKHTGARDALRLQDAAGVVAAKKAEQAGRVSQSVFGPDGVANTAGGGRVIMLPDGSFGYSTPAREQGSPGEVGMTDAMTGLNPSKMYQAPGGGMSLQEANSFGPVDKKSSAPYQAAQMDAENVRAQARKEAALNMLSHAVPPRSQVVTNGSPGFIPSAVKWFVENPGFAQKTMEATKSVGDFFQGLKEAPSVTMDWLKTKFGSDAPPEGPKAEPATQVTSTPEAPAEPKAPSPFVEWAANNINDIARWANNINDIARWGQNKAPDIAGFPGSQAATPMQKLLSLFSYSDMGGPGAYGAPEPDWNQIYSGMVDPIMQSQQINVGPLESPEKSVRLNKTPEEMKDLLTYIIEWLQRQPASVPQTINASNHMTVAP